MKGIKYAGVVCCLAALAGCTTMAGRSTKDPGEKLQRAAEDISTKYEPVEAERLIREAINAYGKKNDQLGLAEAYRQYGLFFRSNAVNTAEDYYQENGFLDKTVRFSDRYEKAIDYFNLSKDLFSALSRYDALSGLYVSLAKTYDLTNRRDEACNAFYKSLESFALFKLNNPEVDERRSEEITDYMDYVESMKQQAGCPETVVPAVPSQPTEPSLSAPTSPYAPQTESAPTTP